MRNWPKSKFFFNRFECRLEDQRYIRHLRDNGVMAWLIRCVEIRLFPTGESQNPTLVFLRALIGQKHINRSQIRLVSKVIEVRIQNISQGRSHRVGGN